MVDRMISKALAGISAVSEKKDDKTDDTHNYQPVSFASICWRIVEEKNLENFMKYLRESGLIKDRHFEFCQGVQHNFNSFGHLMKRFIAEI